MVKLTINDLPIEVEDGKTVLQAAEALGIVIPTLCHHKDLTPFGGCRLCVVEVKGARLPATACNLPVSANLVVHTETPRLVEYRRAVLRMLLSSFYDAGYTRTDGHMGVDDDTQFAHWVHFYGLDLEAEMAARPRYPIDSDPNPYVWVDLNKCIQCTRCVRACAEVQGRFVWAQAYRGAQARIVAGADATLLASRCESCGACIAYCPTGALAHKPSITAGRAERLVRTTCTYCSLGCQLDLNVKGDRVIRVTSSAGAPGNGLHLCVKGRFGYEFVHDRGRLEQPQVRRYLLEGLPKPQERDEWVPVDWDTALQFTTQALQRSLDEGGPQAVGVLASARLTNEEALAVQKLARVGLRTNNIDVAAFAQHAPIGDEGGERLMQHTLDELTHQAGSALLVGAAVSETHPILGVRLRQSAIHGHVKLVVVDSDFTNMAEVAALHLAHRPGSESAVLHGLLGVLIENNWYDRRAAAGPAWEALQAHLAEYSPAHVAETSGLAGEALRQAAELLWCNRPAALVWGVGMAQWGQARPVQEALKALQMLLGGPDDAWLYPLEGQANLQGLLDAGCRPNRLPHGALDDPQARAQWEAENGLPLPADAGLSAAQMLSAAKQGRLTSLLILGEDLLGGAGSNPLAHAHLHAQLAACRTVIVHAPLPGETAALADILLPGATFAEKTGTFTNLEGILQSVNAAIPLVAGARPEGEVAAEMFALKV